MTCIEPFVPRRYSPTEIARLQAIPALADELADIVLACVEHERVIVKDRIARSIQVGLVSKGPWDDNPPRVKATRPVHVSRAAQPAPAPAGSAVHALTIDERWIVAEALRTHAEAELKRLTPRPRVSVVGRLRHDLKRWSEEATRLSVLVDGAARVDIWPCAWSTPRPG